MTRYRVRCDLEMTADDEQSAAEQASAVILYRENFSAGRLDGVGSAKGTVTVEEIKP